MTAVLDRAPVEAHCDDRVLPDDTTTIVFREPDGMSTAPEACGHPEPAAAAAGPLAGVMPEERLTLVSFHRSS